MPKSKKGLIYFVMKAKQLNFREVYKLIQTYMEQKGKAVIKWLYLSNKTKRGRPPKYPFAMILTMLFIQLSWHLSFREVEFFAVLLFGREKIPDFST